MPKLQGYTCGDCDAPYEFMHMDGEEAECPKCGSKASNLMLGGRTFTTIVPDYPGAKKHKAGYIHNYVNRPAEKTYVTVPRKKDA